MIRVARTAVFLRAPDYSGTFEAHYHLPWLPLFPRPIAKIYLRILGKPISGLNTIQYVTKRRIKKTLRNYSVEVFDQNRFEIIEQKVKNRMHLDKLGLWGNFLGWMGAWAWRIYASIRRLFRVEKTINLVIVKKNYES